MSMEYSEAFFNSFQSVMPQLGIEDISLNGIEDLGSAIHTPEVVCIIGIVGDLKGNVIFAMSTQAALKIASIMMGGMELEEFDELAQSAISELGNMLAATACTELSYLQVRADVSTPTLMVGTFTISSGANKITRIDIGAADIQFDIYLSMERK